MYDYITLAFYKGEETNKSLLNELTKFLTGEYVHVEIVFSESTIGNNLACGIWQGENVFYRKKTFGRKNWVFKKLRLTKVQVTTIKNYCKMLADNNIGFNYFGFIRAMTAYPRVTDKKVFFCSELIVSAFQEAGLMLDLNASSTTPTAIFCYIKKNAFSDVSPVYENRIKKNPLKTFWKNVGQNKI